MKLLPTLLFESAVVQNHGINPGVMFKNSHLSYLEINFKLICNYLEIFTSRSLVQYANMLLKELKLNYKLS